MSLTDLEKERNFLKKLDHPFIIKVQYAFDDFATIYMGMDYFPGGNLKENIAYLVQIKKITFSEE